MKKKIIFLVITLLLSLVVLLGNGVPIYAAQSKPATSTVNGNSDYVVQFFDRELEDALNEKLGQASGSNITIEQLQGLTSLNLKKQGIKSLDGLEYCTNLKKLDLSYNDITDLSPIGSLSKLEELNISYNLNALYNAEERCILEIVDATPLGNLKNLRILEAKEAALGNVDFLFDMKKLESVDISKNYISSIYSLFDVVKLNSLKKLDISDQLIMNTQCKQGKEGRIIVKPDIWLPSNSSSFVNITNVSAGKYSVKDREIDVDAAEFFPNEISYNELYYDFSDPDKYEGKDFKFDGKVIQGIHLEADSATSTPSVNNSGTAKSVNIATKIPKVLKTAKKTTMSAKTGDSNMIPYCLGILGLSLGAAILAKKKCI